MTGPPVRRLSLVKKLALPLALVVCVGGGFGAAFAVKQTLFSAKVDEPDDHADHDPDDHAEEPGNNRLSVAVRSGDYPGGLKLARAALHDADHGHADPRVRYALALCLEGLERWDDAREAYKELGDEHAPAGVRAVAACGEVRCFLAEGNTAEATAALARAEQGAGPATEVAYLRGRLALHALPKWKAGPFAADRPMGVEPRLPPADYFEWLKLPTAVASDTPATAVTASGGEPTAALAAFTAVLAADPPHPDETAVRLAVANLRFAAGELDDAAREYKRVCDAHPPKPLQVAATFNLGLIRHRRGEWATARQWFTDAADLGVGTPAAAVAWWWVGRTELDAGNEDACRVAWERADLSDDREMTSAVLLGRVFLLLLDGQEERAGKIFSMNGRAATADPQPAVADAIRGHFRLSDHPTRLNREELAEAVRRAELGAPFGPAGRLVFGGWLGDAGEGKEMFAALDAAADATRGPWAVRLALASADRLYDRGEVAAARGRYTAVAAADGGARGDRARLRLAEIALADGKADECVRFCRQVLNRDNEDRDAVLRLLGRGYERLNRPRAAAECFAGRLPTP